MWDTSPVKHTVKNLINPSSENKIIIMCSNKIKKLHLEMISTLVAEGKNDKEIANELIEKKQTNLVYDEVFWEEGDVQKIRKEHCFAPEGMKLCPECKSNIKEKALVCRFCKNELNTVDRNTQEKEIIISQSSYQKFSILGLLIFFSVIFHMIFCEWRDIDYYNDGKGIIFPFNEDTGFGVYADNLLSGNVMIGLMLGILLPVVLIGISIYLYTGWQKDIKLILKKYGVI